MVDLKEADFVHFPAYICRKLKEQGLVVYATAHFAVIDRSLLRNCKAPKNCRNRYQVIRLTFNQTVFGKFRGYKAAVNKCDTCEKGH